MPRLTRLLVPTMAFLLGACGRGADANSVTGPPSGKGAGAAAITATVNGAAWGSTVLHTATYSTQLANFSGFDGSTLIVISVGHPAGPGTYSLAHLNASGSSAIVTVSSKGWNSFLDGGTGSVTFSTLSSSHAVGTFAFVAMPTVGGATGNMQVTNGKFDVTF